uniref:ubiquitinyl hydrolase 1 n=1 Tax=Callithrix jacchus TaxID=9483 RepID=A0A8I3WQQ4_CALJA
MELIFHEKQEGSLCAQHCLNNLLQGEYFTAVELASIAHQLDEEERMRMAEGGVTSEDYRAFLQQPSGNMDDTGFFSIQVITNALKFWGVCQDAQLHFVILVETGFHCVGQAGLELNSSDLPPRPPRVWD